jgi:predicted alpha/beta-hydrolase family hydrolase
MVEVHVHLKSSPGGQAGPPAPGAACQHGGVAGRAGKAAQQRPAGGRVAPLEIETPHGPARAHLQAADRPVGALVLGHGAGGGVSAPNLVAATGAALSESFSVALIEQPYLVAGRRSPAPTAQLDAAWTAVVERLRAEELRDLPLVTGGRSAGARVACRTAAETGAIGVLCLAFPLHPPGRASDPAKSRQPELDAVQVPVLVVQGDRDPFGMPRAGPRHTLVTVPGNHSLRAGLDAVAAPVGEWLRQLVR